VLCALREVGDLTTHVRSQKVITNRWHTV